MNLENDKFPAGLRVLVVDDDTTYLRLMESLLKKCHYHVTTTNQAREALRMLKENKNRFDIVITDVEMPEIDGIKLLQLVGLEMNLPVIMLSAYSDTKLVMQGIRNGACDYLVKPVRIQELQNIWQHVVRRNKSIPQRAGDYPTGGNAPFAAPNRNATQDMTHRGKGIAESFGDDNDDDEMEEGGRENEDPTNQKKPRLFWSVELHQKFVDAVNQLGLDKAFPKKILDLMNVEGLTREKVASHLQKYRLYLRKVNSGPNQHGNRLDVLGQEDAHIGPLGGGYGVYRSLAGPGRFPGIDLPGGMFGRLNTATGLSLKSLSSSPMLQTPQLTNPNNSFNTFGKLDSLGMSTNQNTNLFPGVPKVSLFNPPTTSIMLNGNPTLNANEYVNQASLFSPPSNVGGLVMSGVANFPNWGTSHSNSFTQNILPPNASDGITSTNASTQNDPLDIFCGISSLGDVKGNAHNQDSLSGFNNLNNIGHQQIWPNQGPNHNLNSRNISTTSSSLIPKGVAPVVVGENEKQNNNNSMGASPFTQLEGSSSKNEGQKPNNTSDHNFDGHYLLDDQKLLSGSGQSSSEYLEDIVGRFLK